MQPTKILIIRFSSIGDIVLTSPVVRCLKQQLEGEVEIHYLTKSKFASLLTANPHISKLWTIEDNVTEVIEELQQEMFDHVIDLHNNIRSGQVKRQLKMLSFTVDKINWKKWLKVNLKIDRLPQKHIVDRYMETCKAFSLQNDGKGLEHFIPPGEEVEKSVLPATHQAGYVAFAIGGTYVTKRLTEEKIMGICKRIKRPVVLLGGREDASIGHKVGAYLGEHIFNACGSFSINQSASLVKQAEKVIAHDSGMMHMAAAFKKDIISIWGNTIPEFGMYPYLPEGQGSSTLFEITDLDCRPCTKLGYDKCPKKHFHCIERIDDDEVADAVNG